MIPVLVKDEGGDRSQVLEGPVCCAPCDDCLTPGQDCEHGGGMEPRDASVPLPCPKLCSRLYPLVLSTLDVSFSIPAFAGTSVPAHPATRGDSATSPALASRSVTKLL